MNAKPPTYHALCEALDDEYKARATYLTVIDAFGSVLPFTHIAMSEQRHINALHWLFERFGWTPPEDRWLGRIVPPKSLAEACETAVQAEIDNAALYDRLYAMTDDETVLNVFRNLRHASSDCHLPAFQRFLKGEDAAVCGTGHEHRHHAHGGGRCCGGHGRHPHGGCAA